jgi:hypothetical protein
LRKTEAPEEQPTGASGFPGVLGNTWEARVPFGRQIGGSYAVLLRKLPNEARGGLQNGFNPKLCLKCRGAFEQGKLTTERVLALRGKGIPRGHQLYDRYDTGAGSVPTLIAFPTYSATSVAGLPRTWLILPKN